MTINDLPRSLQRAIQRLIRSFAPERIMSLALTQRDGRAFRQRCGFVGGGGLRGKPIVHKRRAQQLAGDCFPRVDVVSRHPERSASAQTLRSPFLLSILGSGIVIYKRP